MKNTLENEVAYPFTRETFSTTEIKFLRKRAMDMANRVPRGTDVGVGPALVEVYHHCSTIIANIGEVTNGAETGKTYEFEGKDATRTECEFLRIRFREIRDMVCTREGIANHMRIYAEIDELLNAAGFRLAHYLDKP